MPHPKDSIMARLVLAAAILSIAFVAGCKREFEALPDTACPKIVSHSKALLGEGVKDKSDDELLGVCMASTPKQRGCVMAATRGADIMKCSLVKE